VKKEFIAQNLKWRCKDMKCLNNKKRIFFTLIASISFAEKSWLYYSGFKTVLSEKLCI